MRLLLDECVPRPLKKDLPGHDVSTVVELGWSSKRNSDLLRLMLAQGFEGFLTVDQNIAFQQNVAASAAHLNRGALGTFAVVMIDSRRALPVRVGCR